LHSSTLQLKMEGNIVTKLALGIGIVQTVWEQATF